MDIVDQASELEEADRAAALARIVRFNPAIRPPDGRDCASCGDPIPPARLQAMPTAERCTECQARHSAGR